jgi:hypothetical protein
MAQRLFRMTYLRQIISIFESVARQIWTNDSVLQMEESVSVVRAKTARASEGISSLSHVLLFLNAISANGLMSSKYKQNLIRYKKKNILDAQLQRESRKTALDRFMGDSVRDMMLLRRKYFATTLDNTRNAWVWVCRPNGRGGGADGGA